MSPQPVCDVPRSQFPSHWHHGAGSTSIPLGSIIEPRQIGLDTLSCDLLDLRVRQVILSRLSSLWLTWFMSGFSNSEAFGPLWSPTPRLDPFDLMADLPLHTHPFDCVFGPSGSHCPTPARYKNSLETTPHLGQYNNSNCGVPTDSRLWVRAKITLMASNKETKTLYLESAAGDPLDRCMLSAGKTLVEAKRARQLSCFVVYLDLRWPRLPACLMLRLSLLLERGRFAAPARVIMRTESTALHCIFLYRDHFASSTLCSLAILTSPLSTSIVDSKIGPETN